MRYGTEVSSCLGDDAPASTSSEVRHVVYVQCPGRCSPVHEKGKNSQKRFLESAMDAAQHWRNIDIMKIEGLTLRNKKVTEVEEVHSRVMIAPAKPLEPSRRTFMMS